MPDGDALHDALQTIGAQTDSDMSERDVENLFLEYEFYDALGYEGTGVDLQSEFSLPNNRRPDYITRDTNEAVTAVYEFKTTGVDLLEHESQLFDYMDHLRSEYGVLTNGETLRLYRRGEETAISVVALESATTSEARDLVSALEKREFDLTDPDDVNQLLDNPDPIPLNRDAELGKEHFFDTFQLDEGSPFTDLVTGMMDLLHELRDEQEAKFVEGAYDFWEATYADIPDEDDIPDAWEPFIDDGDSLRDFMFCLESGHALLSRLLLAKATEDHDFFAGTGYDGMQGYFRGLQGFSDRINLDAFPVAANNLIDDMQEQLVEGLFQDDIFVWWTDGYREQLDRGHGSGANQFEDVARGSGSVERISEATRNRFSRAVAEVFFNVLRFDFEDVQGDLLGDLYQQYFDPETRKALGEFYTPQPVVDYIMDGVGYDRGVSGERLIDPACGSGTFLVEAIERYLDDIERYEDDPDWEEHLRDLCTRPRVVGLDIHPFAVLMAQIRFVVAILPAYQKAKTQNPEFTLRRLPIYRTDTLRNERKLTGVDLGDDGTQQLTFDAVTEDEQDVLIPVPLPVEVDEDDAPETDDGFLVRRVRMPLFETIQLETGVGNFGEYFAALQGVLDNVKDHMNYAEEVGDDFDWEYQSGLTESIGTYTSRDYDGVEEFFAPYVDDMLENVRYLKEEHNDGRLFKMFEDTVLALVVKNYMEYDYVVGNPPYVRKKLTSPEYKQNILENLYPGIYSGDADLSIYFQKRGIEMLNRGGKLGYITSSRFTSTAYGEGLRKKLAKEVKISEFSNFEMSDFFEDVSAYPCVVIYSNTKIKKNYKIDTVYGREKPDKNKIKEVLKQIRSRISDNRSYTTDYYATYETEFTDLNKREWRFTPKKANKLFRKLQEEADYELNQVVDKISAGIKSGKNSVFILTEEEAEELEIEEEVLRPIYRGSDVERFKIGQADEFIIYTHNIDIKNYPNTLKYLKKHKEKLKNRQDATFKNRDKKWYELNIPHTASDMERTKIISPEMSERNNYAIDENGKYILNKVMFSHVETDAEISPEFLLGLLNSSTLEFSVKQTSSPLENGYYQYLTRYQERLPIKLGSESENIEKNVKKIRKITNIKNKVSTFPSRYVKDHNGELQYINYEWQTRRHPVNADVQGDGDGDFTVQAGRTDTIRDPAMYSDDREARKRRAEYVHAAVDGRNVKRGEEMSIPIPRSDAGVEELLTRLEEDRERVAETDIDALEAEIDEAVYDLFDLTPDERAVVEEYLEVF